MAVDPALIGLPVLVGPAGSRVLERLPLTPSAYGEIDEAWLQRLIHDHPACLPIAEVDPSQDEPFISVCREMPLAAGSVDNLLMTRSGDIAIVETKLFRNPEARRKVVAQALDYASCLLGMGYEAFEKAALGGAFDAGPKPAALYAAVTGADAPDDGGFHDKVSRNLRLGRILVLIVGDGIREEAQTLASGLHAHVGSAFTLALIEMGIFRMSDAGEYLVRPRTLTKTEIVQRTTVEIVDGKPAIKVEEVTSENDAKQTFWTALESKAPNSRAALERLIGMVVGQSVTPEIAKSLIFRARRSSGKRVNLGAITNNGVVWTDGAFWGGTPFDLAKAYVIELASAFGCDAHADSKQTYWTLYSSGKPLRVGAIRDKLDRWPPIMQRFSEALRLHDEEAGTSDLA